MSRVLLLVMLGCSAVRGWAAPVRFSREVLPILSEKCLSCHGPDESHRKGGLRLDTREGALEVRDGEAAIVPGKPELSGLMERITSEDGDEVMPPPSSHRERLTGEEVELLRRWILEGAEWGKHWAYERPVRGEAPLGGEGEEGAKAAGFPLRGAIDGWVWWRLREDGMRPSPEAERHTLLRRVTFDLTGLPPTAEEVAAFDGSEGSYEAAVDRLLGSGHFGERMAMWWLDAARYADTDGFQADANRQNWPWRDWVVKAFNENKRFDRFTLEQFAGDLLPGATQEEKLATAFHRNHMTNGEGGRDPEESRVDYALDRVNTMGAVWLGLTLGCTQCHAHKFDPITQADYYGLMAYFNSIDEDGKAGREAKPYLVYESEFAARAIGEAEGLVNERKVREKAARAEAEGAFGEWLAARGEQVRGGYETWHVLRGALETSEGTELRQEADGVVVAGGAHPNQDDYRLVAPVRLPRVTGVRLEVLPDASHTKGAYSRGKTGEFILTDIKVQVRRRGSSQVRDVAVKSAVADTVATGKGGYGDVQGVLDDDPRNGWTTKGAAGKTVRTAVFGFAEPVVAGADEELVIELRQRSTLGDANIGRFRVAATDEAGPAVAGVGAAPLEELAAGAVVEGKLRGRLFEQFLADHEPYQVAKRALDRAMGQLGEAKAAKVADVMVLAERKEPRETHVLVRGVWDKPGEKVERGGLAAIAPLGVKDPSRADLARWLTSAEHPLTARVLVNHLWQLCFGAGLVRTNEDFGLQGERPLHPELLDWLAVECVESGWDVKRLLRLMVTSSTYRQSSRVSEEMLARDPENRWLARGSRFRLPSWMLRDAVLRASGLLHGVLGGPPVKPYQPEGVWEENFMGRFRYEPSEGVAQYRRTLYAFWRRSVAPTFLFDAAQRRSCEVRMPRTNTPLQALTLLNDENYLEAARALAADALTKEAPLREMGRRVLSRELSGTETGILERERDRALAYYRGEPEAAARFLGRGQFRADPGLPAAELAAHAVVASLLFNLDEAITHE